MDNPAAFRRIAERHLALKPLDATRSTASINCRAPAPPASLGTRPTRSRRSSKATTRFRPPTAVRQQPNDNARTALGGREDRRQGAARRRAAVASAAGAEVALWPPRRSRQKGESTARSCGAGVLPGLSDHRRAARALCGGARKPRRAARLYTDAVATARPDILDRNGEVLATDIMTPSLFAAPRRIIDADEASEF